MALSVCSCGEPDYTDKNVVFRTEDGITTFDPQLASTKAEFTAAANCFDGLCALGSDGKITMGAASGYTVSDDGLTYTFTLRDGMLWSDGETRVTADDFVFGITRGVLPETKAPFASLLFSVKNAENVYNGKTSSSALGVKANGDNQVIITLSRRDRNILQTLASPVAMPCNRKFFESTNGKYGLDDDSVLGNGAYYLRMWNTEENYFSLRRFDEFNGEAAIPYSVTVGYSRETQDIYSSLTTGEVNIAYLSGELASKLNKEKFSTKPYYNISYALVFSPKMPEKLRCALIADTDISAVRMNLPEYYSKTNAVIPNSAIEGELNYRDTVGELTLQKYDAANAKKLYAEFKDNLSEYTDDSKDGGIDFEKYTVYFPKGDEDIKRSAGLIVQQWQRDLNAFINTAEYDGSDFAEKLKSGEFMAAIVPISSMTGTAFDALNELKSMGYDGFAEKLPKSNESAEQSCAQLKKAEQYLVDENYIVPMFCVPKYCCMTANIADVATAPSGDYIDFKYIKKSSD